MARSNTRRVKKLGAACIRLGRSSSALTEDDYVAVTMGLAAACRAQLWLK